MKHKFLSLWIFFHTAVFLAFFVSLAISPEIHFGTSLFEILPPSSELHEVQEADSILGDKTSRTVTILVKAKTFEQAKEAAINFYEKYNEPGDFFDNLSLYVDSSSMTEIIHWLHKNRFALLSDDDISLLEKGRAEEIADDALSSVYGAFSISDLSYLEEDPFLLTERSLKRFLEDGAISTTNMALKDNVLACQKDDNWYVLIRGTVSEKGSALASEKNTVKSIYKNAGEITKSSPEIEFIFSGVPFHSYENSTSAQKQITVISSVSLALIIVLFLLIFHSVVPALISAIAVAFSCIVGFISVLLFFREIHILTFVFGTTLIGTCLDYSIHFFVNWKANLMCNNGTTVRNHIIRGISLGFASTEICFGALFFSPFPLLKQVSVFLFFGLTASYLSVVALYPNLKMPEKRTALAKLITKPHIMEIIKTRPVFRKSLRFLPVFLAIFSVIVILSNYHSLKIQNNIQELYSMSPEMLQNEITSAKVLNTGSSGWYFILKADSRESLLQKNEELSEFLSDCIEKNKLGNFLSISQFIPSEKKQSRSFTACENLLPVLDFQFEALGFEKNLSENYISNYRSFSQSLEPLPSTIQDAISNLWIGEIDGNFYSCVLPLHTDRGEEHYFREYARNHQGIYFVNKVNDISSQLDVLSKTMLKLLALAFIFVIAILFFCYKPRVVLKIASVPVLVTLVTTSVLLLAKVHLSFFPITALVLVFGLGLDYIIYSVEDKKNQTNDSSSILTTFSIFFSFATTALSFGALALSTFPPVHMLGLTVFVGLLAAIAGAFSSQK